MNPTTSYSRRLDSLATRDISSGFYLVSFPNVPGSGKLFDSLVAPIVSPRSPMAVTDFSL